MPSVAASRSANASYAFPAAPVAIFVGGTSGIGQAVAEALARHTNGRVHLIIVGRNRAAAESIFATLPAPVLPDARYEFVECDVTLVKNVAATTSALLARLPKVNYLVLSPGILSFRGRRDTSEGIDRKLALSYYARWKFTQDLLPLLRAAKGAGEDARVMSVLAAGEGGKIDVEDLGLKESYSGFNAMLVASTYNDLMVESFAEQETGASFVHIYPGVVRTPIVNRIVQLLLYPFVRAPEDCAEHMLYALLHADAGAHRRGANGDDIGRKAYYGSDEARAQLWTHTVEEVQRALDVKPS
ncbi:hypothetical protein POSPLADRAFT_1048273 [Postia placenta MAD-698-R-SB12]|uniref:NAD(P)-binding protein n=1 Tax=Postia placenta MAD-698-R-SB12 TaxID=670580 RepID=A0A1X6MUD4_9APHY|nr:hypothetical protein POSPLADRAFT_1048273 [Postia placenta MAD-698-R-SB12]OSX59803.1 hypothetical protein POSPLADRAFT_1048273 [Postia placenta MAD-698-R-SB12]